MKKILVLLAIFMLFCTATAGPSRKIISSGISNIDGDILYVGGDGPNNYTRIRDAIDNASNGDTVFVYDDSAPYYENIIVDKSIDLIGEDKDTTIIDGGSRLFNGKDCKRVGVYREGNQIYYKTATWSKSYQESSSGSDGLMDVGGEDDDVIVISADEVTLSGFTVQNSGLNSGDSGIEIYSKWNFIQNNRILNCIRGITINTQYDQSPNNILRENQLIGCGLVTGGATLFEYINDVDTSNTVNGKPLYYLINENALDIPLNAGQIYLINSSNCTITELILEEATAPIVLAYSNDNTIINNTIRFNALPGMVIDGSSYNLISNNDVSYNFKDAILTWSTSAGNCGYNTFSNNRIVNNGWWGFDSISVHDFYYSNTITDNGLGIGFCNPHNIIENNILINNAGSGILTNSNYGPALIKNNTIDNNQLYGIKIEGSKDFTILENTFSQNGYGIKVTDHHSEQSVNISIYHNNFIDSEITAYDNCNNTWNNDYPSGGNYWDNFEGVDDDSDGIGDTSYEIEGGDNEDKYPLMQPYSPTEFEFEVRNKVILRNIGDSDAYATSLTIEIKGGILGLINKSAEHIVGILPVDGKSVIRFPFIFGLGRITITISAIAGNADELTAIIPGYAIGPFIFIVP